jgi:FkbM family methyltransferase
MPEASADELSAEAQRLASAGRWVEAEGVLRKALAANPNEPSVLSNLGIVLANQGHRNAAIELLQRAAERVPGNQTIQRNLAHIRDTTPPQLTDRQLEVHAANHAYNMAIKRVIIENAVNCVIDVGANVGDFAAHVRKLGYRGRIVSIEPASKPYAELVARAAADSEWKTLQLAAGRSEGTAQLKILGDSVLNTLGDPDPEQIRDFGKRGQVVGQETVRVRPLDALWDDLFAGIKTPRVLLKIDTQGHDQEVLAGASQRVLASTVALQTELSIVRLYLQSPTFTQSLEPLLTDGWGIVGMYPTARYEDTHTAIELDCLMTRALPSS